MITRTLKINMVVGLVLLAGIFNQCVAQTNQVVYTDSLANGWENWSWAPINLNNGTPARSGKSIAVTPGAWEAAYFHHETQNALFFTNLTFWIHGGSAGGQQLSVRLVLGQALKTPYDLLPLVANAWQQITIPISALGVASSSDFDGFWIQDRSGVAQPTFYVDDIVFIGGTPPPPPPAMTNGPVAIAVDALRDRHPISDLIYGVAFASSNQLKDLNVPVHRSGGNPESRYNWQANASNRGFDYYFQSIPESSSAQGGAGDRFVEDSKAAGAEAMLTIPTLGWVARLGPGRSKLTSYSISKYGPQTGNDWQWFPDSGNGISVTNNTPITWNDPTDANVLVDSTFQQQWVRHLTNRWGSSTNGGVRYYMMDNEPSLWHSTHRDVHPIGATMREVRDKFFDYAAKVKAVDPAALVVGPEEWGWSGYLMSGYDQQWGAQHGWNNLPDRATNGGALYLPWFLDQVRQRATNTNQRLLDIFSVHYYPQGGEFNPQNENVTETMQLRRNRSTRSLWDTNYIDQSWINDRVMLIPRLKNWVASYYFPGTPVAITEYNWGAEDHINGATTQADILGIFGREGLDLAARWTTPASNSPTYKAMKMYRNYDGTKAGFGNVSVYAGGPNPDHVSTFAALRDTDGGLTVMIINKQLSGEQPITLSVTNHPHASVAQSWQLTSSNIIQRLADRSFEGNVYSNTFPAQSITLLVLPIRPSPTLHATPGASNTVSLHVSTPVPAFSGQYVIQSSANLSEWTAWNTNAASLGDWNLMLPATNTSGRFFRVEWRP